MNDKLDFAFLKLAKALDADEDELLLLVGKIPHKIRRRVLDRPEPFRRAVGLDDRERDRVLAG